MKRQSPCQLDEHGLVEQGQTTIAMAGVLAVAILLIGGLVHLGSAMVHRHRAQTAADAVVLAAVQDLATADALVDWYGQRSISVEHSAGQAVASSGPSMARAWASTSAGFGSVASPALVAIVARAEQLTGERFASARVTGDRVDLNAVDATGLRLVAAELGLCERAGADSATDTSFGLC